MKYTKSEQREIDLAIHIEKLSQKAQHLQYYDKAIVIAQTWGNEEDISNVLEKTYCIEKNMRTIITKISHQENNLEIIAHKTTKYRYNDCYDHQGNLVPFRKEDFQPAVGNGKLDVKFEVEVKYQGKTVFNGVGSSPVVDEYQKVVSQKPSTTESFLPGDWEAVFFEIYQEHVDMCFEEQLDKKIEKAKHRAQEAVQKKRFEIATIQESLAKTNKSTSQDQAHTWGF